MESFFDIEGDFLFLKIKAVPGASKTSFGEVCGEKLKVRIAAAPIDGKANEELRAFLAKSLGLAKKDIVLESGEKSRSKILRLPAFAKDKLAESISLRRS